MTDVEILEKARDLLSNPARWTQGELARDEAEKEVGPLNQQAVCWCAFGSVDRIAGKEVKEGEGPNVYLAQASIELFGSDIVRVNDELGYDATLQMFDRAIELAGA